MHEGQLVFHTPPYSLQDVTLQDTHLSTILGVSHRSHNSKVEIERSKSVISQTKGYTVDESGSEKFSASSTSPFSSKNKKPLGRRFSYTSRYRYFLIFLF